MTVCYAVLGLLISFIVAHQCAAVERSALASPYPEVLLRVTRNYWDDDDVPRIGSQRNIFYASGRFYNVWKFLGQFVESEMLNLEKSELTIFRKCPYFGFCIKTA